MEGCRGKVEEGGGREEQGGGSREEGKGWREEGGWRCVGAVQHLRRLALLVMPATLHTWGVRAGPSWDKGWRGGWDYN